MPCAGHGLGLVGLSGMLDLFWNVHGGGAPIPFGIHLFQGVMYTWSSLMLIFYVVKAGAAWDSFAAQEGGVREPAQSASLGAFAMALSLLMGQLTKAHDCVYCKDIGTGGVYLAAGIQLVSMLFFVYVCVEKKDLPAPYWNPATVSMGVTAISAHHLLPEASPTASSPDPTL